MHRIHGGTIVCWGAAAVGAAGCGAGACVVVDRVFGGGVSCFVLGGSSWWSVVVVPGGWSWALRFLGGCGTCGVGCVSLVRCRCVLFCALGCYVSPWGPALSVAVFCGVSPRCVLCAVCVLSWCGGACRCSLLCFVLWLSWVVLLCVPCPPRSVPCCATLCYAVLVRLRCVVRAVCTFSGARCCGASLCVVLLPVVCSGAVLGLAVHGCLLVACYGVGVPVWPLCLFPCGWSGLLRCTAPLCFVLWCCAFLWCCALVFCCVFAVLFVLGGLFSLKNRCKTRKNIPPLFSEIK